MGKAFEKWKLQAKANTSHAKILALQRQKQMKRLPSPVISGKIIAAVAEAACSIKRMRYVRVHHSQKEAARRRRSNRGIGGGTANMAAGGVEG